MGCGIDIASSNQNSKQNSKINTISVDIEARGQNVEAIFPNRNKGVKKKM